MPTQLFNSEFLGPLLHKISSEKKQIILLGDFNINLLKADEMIDNIFLLSQRRVPKLETIQSVIIYHNFAFFAPLNPTTLKN